MARPDPLLTNGFTRVMMCRHGPMMYNINDTYIGRQLDAYGEYLQKQVGLFRQAVPIGGVAVDIGANIGAFTVPLAHHVGESGAVLAFEPQRFVYQMLCGNIAINSLTNVRAFRAACGREQGKAAVPLLNPATELNFGSLSLATAWPGPSDEVPMLVLDQLKLPVCHFIKIDVEGMELDVLQGSADTIARCRPILFVENERPENSKELITLLLSFGYRLWWHMIRFFNPNNYFSATKNVFAEDTWSLNMLGIPKETRVYNLPGSKEILSAEAPHPLIEPLRWVEAPPPTLVNKALSV